MSVIEAPGNKVDPEKGYQEAEAESHHGKWSSRWSFILASIGSAIGLGNFWRFPYLAFRWGGGAFFIPYFIALFVVGIPLLQIEFALGQVFRRAATQAFGRLGKHFAGIGLAAGFIAFSIVGYYCVVLGWSNAMLVQSFFKEMPWSIEGVTGSETVSKPVAAYMELLQFPDDTTQTTIMSSYVFAGAYVMWISIYLILVKGQNFISKAVWVTVLLPVGTLFILLVVGATRDGAEIGIKAYIGEWDMSLLSEGQMWVDAFSQIFFSLSLATGVMSAFASMNPKNQNIVQDAFIVAICNSLFSFMAGFAVFSIAGYMSKQSGISIADLQGQGLLSGPMLAFVAYPAGLSLVGGAGGNVLCVIFFITVYMLGVDSAFSLVESVIHNYKETYVFHTYSRVQMVSVFCFLCMSCTFIYTADIGLNILDVVDRYISSFGLAVIGWLEAFVFAWCVGKSESAQVAGSLPVMLHDILFWLGVVLFTALSLGLPYVEGLDQMMYLGVPLIIGIVLVVLSFIIPVAMAAGQAGGVKEALYAVTMQGVDKLRIELNEGFCEGAPDNWRFPFIWAVNVKYIINPVLFFLMGLNVESLSATPYSGLGPGYQAIGTIYFLIMVLIFVVGLIFPHLYSDPKAI
ncbi:Sodium-dependent serotonin transporter [Hondaea fermentalgiana]|uniref:Sodium-dependent serotonin transporter n=1 Tax=Hondaea fermentalgiana TaxID=2315210 RepID=A0A2R5GTE1_9STRA|nr:Sodium-dependent serotonin transporter [Hondaea fermentalgiana]|eukprot:GBG31154.1 Sodium-dependent serotonin transporter [Hondaea fermentalgiana]